MKTIPNSQFVGIDLGTSNSVIAFLSDSGKPQVILSLEGDPKIPSCVHFERNGKNVLVGAPAWNMQMLEPHLTFIEFKRDCGTATVYTTVDGQEITPERCQSELLKYLRQCAIKQFGDKRAASKVVLSVPAHFGEKARQSTKRAAEAA